MRYMTFYIHVHVYSIDCGCAMPPRSGRYKNSTCILHKLHAQYMMYTCWAGLAPNISILHVHVYCAMYMYNYYTPLTPYLSDLHLLSW